jgi:predicted RND superfamily exporter protein
MGILSAIVIAVALFFDLLFLPALIRWSEGGLKSTEKPTPP